MRFLFFIVLLFGCVTETSMPTLPLVNGEVDRRVVVEGMVRQMYGTWPSEELVARLAQQLELPRLKARYVEWHLSPPHAPARFLRLGLFLPAHAVKPITFLTLNRCGNDTLLPDEVVPTLPRSAGHPVSCQGAARGTEAAEYGVEYLLSQGFALATFASGDMDVDLPSNRDGVKELYPGAWGTLSAWAWGLSESARVLQDSGLVGEIYTSGHSRRGKAALLAAALNPRIAGTFPHQSGLGGTAGLRGAGLRESAAMITQGGRWYRLLGEPEGLTHFFSTDFQGPAQNSAGLPYDAHFLLALVAPRLLVDSQGEWDFWAGPRSAHDMLTLAAPAWGAAQAPSYPVSQLPARPPAVFQVIFPGGHKQDRAFWEMAVGVLRARR